MLLQFYLSRTKESLRYLKWKIAAVHRQTYCSEEIESSYIERGTRFRGTMLTIIWVIHESRNAAGRLFKRGLTKTAVQEIFGPPGLFFSGKGFISLN